MQYKQLSVLALASTVTAQNEQNGTNGQSLSDVLNSQNSSLSSLNTVLQENPEFLRRLKDARNVTLLAPNNAAVDRLVNDPNTGRLFSQPGYLENLLSYHVLNGTYYGSNFSEWPNQFIPTHLTNHTFSTVTGGQRVQAVSRDNNVTFYSALKQNVTPENTDMNFTGGTLHIIDGILAIPQNLTDTLTNANLTAAAGAFQHANLTQNINNNQDVTIFAPNNDAFDKIGSIFSNFSSERLRNIVGYHVVDNVALYSTALNNQTLRAENGQDIHIRHVDGQIFANFARVTIPNILIQNGVVHVIDQVLNPDNSTGEPTPSETSAPPAFTDATAGPVFILTSGISAPTTTVYPAATSTTADEPSSSSGLAVPMKTGAVGAAALFGGAAMLANL